ncbi:MAG: CvpA family protein [Chitinophagaceae bacterium]
MLIDIVFLALMVIAVFKGFSKGLIIALFSVVAYIVGIAAALKLSTVVANRLKDSISVSNQWLPVISFAVVFIIVVILVRLGAKLIEKTFQVALLGWVNRLAGILLFIVIYTLIYSVVLFYADKMGLLKPETIATSNSYNYIAPWGPKVIDGLAKLIPVFKDMFSDLESFFDSLAKKAA